MPKTDKEQTATRSFRSEGWKEIGESPGNRRSDRTTVAEERIASEA
jgi:hypothetical protein